MSTEEPTVLDRTDARKAFNAFLAAVKLRGITEMVGPPKILHAAFGSALATLAGNEATSAAFGSYRCDSEGELITEFDDALMRAEKYKLVQFPNPTYTRVRIAMTPMAAEDFLEAIGDARPVFESAAERFRECYMEQSW